MKITEKQPVTPGTILFEKFIEPNGLSQEYLAKSIKVARRRINEIINGKRSITSDTALRLAHLFNTTPEYWLNLQMKYDLWKELHLNKLKQKLKTIKPLRK